MMKNLFYLPIFTLVLISNTFSDNTMNKNPQVINNNVYKQIKTLGQQSSKQVQSNKVIPMTNTKINKNISDRVKMFENSATVKKKVPMQNNPKLISKEKISMFESNNNNLSNKNISITKSTNKAQKFTTQQTKVRGKLILPKDQLNNINSIVGKHNYMLAQDHMNNPSSYTIPNKKHISSNNNAQQNTNQTQFQKRLMKDKQQALNNKKPVKIVNGQLPQQQQQINTYSPMHSEITQQYNNREDTSIKSQLQNIINTVKFNTNISNNEVILQANQWNNIIKNAVNSKLSKEYINTAIKTVINSSNITSSTFYNNIIKMV